MINEQPDYRIAVDSPSEEPLTIHVPSALIVIFKKLIWRGLNTYTDCHPALKEFGDVLEHGRVLQDYYSQRSDIKSGRSVQEILLDGTAFEILPLESSKT